MSANAALSFRAFLISSAVTYGYSPYSKKLGHWATALPSMNNLTPSSHALAKYLPCKSRPKVPSRHGLPANIGHTNEENSERLRDCSVGLPSLESELYKITFVAVIGSRCSMRLMLVAHSVEHQTDSAGNSGFVEDSKQVVLDCVFT